MVKVKNVLPILFVLFMSMLQAQNTSGDDGLTYEREFSRIIQIPTSPEASAFQTYGDYTASLYSGLPNIDLPFYTIEGREFSVPVSINYQGGGIKVEQIATNAGLGWSLNAGGRITRITNGFPDDVTYTSKGFKTIMHSDVRDSLLLYLEERQVFNSQAEAAAYLNFVEQISKNEIDTQPDYFRVNAPGLSDVIVFDYDINGVYPKTLHNPRIKVTAQIGAISATNSNIQSFTLIHEDGTRYEFNLAENTHVAENDYVTGGSPIIREYNSSWVLTRIWSSNKKDEFIFEYDEFPWTQEYSVLGSSFTSQEIDACTVTTSTYPIQNFQAQYKINQQILRRIKYNGATTVSIDLKNRLDLDVNNAIDKVNIHKYQDSTSYLKKIVFNTSYFTSSNPQTVLDYRLRLDSLSFQTSGNQTIETYSFDYFNDSNFPSRDSYKQDYMGYYNGVNNTVLFPQYTTTNYTLAGADRSVSLMHTKVGSLSRITYPTGGSSDFIYELNSSTYVSEDFQQTAQYTNVLYANNSLTVGVDTNTICGLCCGDKFGSATPPKVSSIVFTLTDQVDQLYNLDYLLTGDSGVFTETYLLKLGEKPCTNGGSIGLSSIPYEEIVDPNTCAVNPKVIWHRFSGNTSNTPEEYQMNLSPGCYQLTLVGGDQGVGANTNLSVQVWRTELDISSNAQIGTGNVPRAGLRIAAIENRDMDNTLLTRKEYRYQSSLTSSAESTGAVNFYPQLFYTETREVWGDTSCNNTPDPNYCNTREAQFLYRRATSSGGDRPHVFYDKVYEVQIANNSSAINGYKIHEFYAGDNGVFSSGLPPNVNSYRSSFEVGKASNVSIRTDAGTIVQEQVNTYEDQGFMQVKGLYIKLEPKDDYDNIGVLNIRADGKVDIYFTRWMYGTMTFGGVTSCSASPPAPCANPLDCYYSDVQIGSMNINSTIAHGRVGRPKTSLTTYVLNGQEVKDSIWYTYYDESVDLLRKRASKLTTENDTLSTLFYYPRQNGVSGALALLNKNNLSEVVKTETYKFKSTGEQIQLSTAEKSYTVITSDIVLPDTLRITQKQGSTRKHFFNYYTNGNIQESGQLGGPTTTYVWGYDQKFPVAQVLNANYSEVSATGYLSSVLNSLSTSTLSKWTELEKIRNGLPGAQVTSYLYDPSVGIVRVSDPTGEFKDFSYDNYNRLEFIKDSDQKLLSEFKYHFQGQN